MLNSIPLLQAVNGWRLLIAAIAGVVSAGAGLISGLAGNRLNDLQEARREEVLEEMRQKDEENAAAVHEAKMLTWFMS